MSARESYWHRINLKTGSREGVLLDLIPARRDLPAVRVWFDYGQMLEFCALIERHRKDEADQGTLSGR